MTRPRPDLLSPACNHPVHAVMLAGCLPLFLGALLSDWAYHSTREVQWINFASWLIPGGLIFAGVALVLAIVDLMRSRGYRNHSWYYLLALGSAFVLGAINALEHGKDAWATMPGGLILSLVVMILALVAVWLGFRRERGGEVR